MRILLIHNYYRERGGEDTYVDMLYTLLKQYGHTVKLFSKKSSSIQHSIIGKFIAGKNLVFDSKQTAQELEKEIALFKPHVAHVHNIYPLLTHSVIHTLRKTKIPIVLTVSSYHLLGPKGSIFFQQSSLKYYGNSYIASALLTLSLYKNRQAYLKAVDAFIFSAAFAIDIYKKFLHLPKQKVHIIPYFSPERKIRPRKKQNFFLYVGRLSPEKGVETLVDIFSRLHTVQLVIIGEGPLRKKLQSTSSKNITFLRRVPEKIKHAHYQNAIATIIPSLPLYEFGPLVLLESYANRTPVIVPHSGVFLERVIEKKTGFFYKSNNPVSLLETLTQVYSKRSMLYQMQEYIFTEYQKHYSPAVHYRNIMNVYQSVLKKT